MRHKEHILHTTRFKRSNAGIGATNYKTKRIVRKAYGFRSIGNLLDMVYLACSNVTVDAALSQADALRQSILKEAFEGRLV